jgi:hypothetical protein
MVCADACVDHQIEVGYDYLGIMEQMLKYHLISGIPAYFFVFLLVLAALARRYAAGSTAPTTYSNIPTFQQFHDGAPSLANRCVVGW